ncbi:hypothetical protein RRG08_065731 [Elysia crispata]|uniref:Uncharacterized protein n=1 Tax=Elysia crispata TaxID=231223 RepID=A0AAE0Z8A0_9GAST|nr:hypothetical protein RRG08_065731 [Elysia crispata]
MWSSRDLWHSTAARDDGVKLEIGLRQLKVLTRTLSLNLPKQATMSDHLTAAPLPTPTSLVTDYALSFTGDGLASCTTCSTVHP